MPPDTVAHEHRLIVLYDGLCGLCDGVVQFLLRHDTKDVFRFAPQQSKFAQKILARHGLDATASETICLIENYGLASERVLTKSAATLRIAMGLGGIWHAARVTVVLPLYLRDAAYDLIARNRYRIFGRRTECRLVTTAEQYKFLG
jgi:predicted DCC family thiol-disulfide oxidoreductase YuxK